MIRDAEVSDAASIANIYNYYIQNTAISFEETSVTAKDMMSRISKTKDAKLPWLVAQQDSNVIGYTYASLWNPRLAYRNSAEITVYLQHGLQTKGWGTKLYQALFCQLRQANFHVAIGGITLPNPASVALHEKFGMQQVAEFKQVGFKFERWLDVGYWQVLLND